MFKKNKKENIEKKEYTINIYKAKDKYLPYKFQYDVHLDSVLIDEGLSMSAEYAKLLAERDADLHARNAKYIGKHTYKA